MLVHKQTLKHFKGKESHRPSSPIIIQLKVSNQYQKDNWKETHMFGN